VLCVGLGVCAWRAAAQSLPNGPGKEVFESVCSLCHDAPAAVMGKQWTRAQWEAKVAEMLQEEPDVTTQERAAIVEYLSTNFKPGGTIYVNKATAKDLEAALELSAMDAERIAHYREEHGSFKTVADLKNVAGISADDLANIEARKDRLAF
jgi:competence ComEA-like helix-hairpin-helix protein